MNDDLDIKSVFDELYRIVTDIYRRYKFLTSKRIKKFFN